MSNNLSLHFGKIVEGHYLMSNKTEFKTLFTECLDIVERRGPGPLSEEEAQNLALRYKTTPTVVFSIFSCYDFLGGWSEHPEKKVYQCEGLSCRLSKEFFTTQQALYKEFSKTEVGSVQCLGLCHQTGSVLKNGRSSCFQEGQELPPIQFLPQSQELPKPQVLPFAHVKTQKSYLLSLGEEAHFDQLLLAKLVQQIKNQSRESVKEEIKKSQLRGRGGAGFPFGTKVQSFLDSISESTHSSYVVCNADEGDPGAFSDKYLLEKEPFKVLFGIWILHWLSQASCSLVYLRYEYPETLRLLKIAIQKFQAVEFFPIHVIRGAGSYVCGEETALLNSIEGQRPEVRLRPPYPTQKGLFGAPSLVSNVETYAQLYGVFQYGADLFASLGTSSSKGNKLISLDYGFCRPGIYEVEMGTPFQEVVEVLGGGFKHPVKALQVGGPLGSIVPIDVISHLNISFESFQTNGFLLGHASIVSIPEEVSMHFVIKHLFDFVAHESCGKCFPCHFGTIHGLRILKNEIVSNKNQLRIEFENLLSTLEMGSLCALGGGVSLPTQQALKYFPEDFSEVFEI